MNMDDRVQNEKLPIAVLYVEDEPITRSAVARMLKRRVEILYEAENGKEGLELFKQNRPNIVISDIRMPVMDGIEMAKEIKLLDKNSKIILTTAHSDASILLDSIEVGVDKYILKPLDMDALYAAMDQCAETVMLERQIQQQNIEKDQLIVKLQEALENVKKLSGLIPICSNCKKIRNDEGYWKQIEGYISEHSEARFSHGICPDCAKKIYSEFLKDVPEEQ